MADAKITALTAMTTPAAGDLIPIVDDPGGSPLTQKITFANFQNGLSIDEANFAFTDITTADSSSDAHGLLAKLPGELTYRLYGTGAWVQDTIVKTTDETVNNSATLQDDNELLFAVVANGYYYFDVFLLITSASENSDFKVGWTVPTSCLMYWNLAQQMPSVTNTNTPQTAANIQSGTLSIPSGNVTYAVKLSGIVLNGANAGNVQFRWAQNTATAENTTVKIGSFIAYRRYK